MYINNKSIFIMGKISVLHLSDLHIGNFIYNDVSHLAISITEAIEENKKNVDCIITTGDIFDGKSQNQKKDIDNAVLFYNCLLTELSKSEGKKLTHNDIIFVPGNHDLVRKKGDVFVKYKRFLKSFYPEDYYNENYNNKYLYTIKIFEDKKIAILGLNSCMIELQKIIDEETKWLKDTKVLGDEDTKKILDALRKERRWDDYGMIELSQLREAFAELKKRIINPDEYLIATCFHHHFYPFPEIYDKFGDSSLIRNFVNVIDKLQRSNVKVVMHGHKHIPIIRPVTNEKYLSDSNSVLYVFSAGSIGKKGIERRSFQIIDLYSPDSNKIADISRFNYKYEELELPEIFNFPPKKKYEQHSYVMLIDILKDEYPEEYLSYMGDVYEIDNVAQDFRVNDIIKNISEGITVFEKVKKELGSNSKYLLIILASIHYRINSLNYTRNSNVKSTNIIDRIKGFIHKILMNVEYEKKIFDLLGSNTNSEFEKYYDIIEKDASSIREEKIITAFCVIATFFTDLYLTLSHYGEYYYKKEGLNANIKLDDNVFHTNIPASTIKIDSDIERRSSRIYFKCKNPTVHKIVVLIIKEFEKRINKIEDSLKLAEIKIYYLIPVITKDNYDLENFNFEAYIPTLLPLLTGDNLYKQKEVFIRELIQNSLDAILLREKIDKDEIVDKTIRVYIGNETNQKSGKDRKYLKVSDSGVGMDEFKIERYFTSIGRSFYVSDEFDELQKNEKIEYKPISNFGIGFLSAFMVCKEIKVLTKSYDGKAALEIQIPNYDGCFFINKSDNNIGTEIILYEDDRKLLDSNKIIEYIKNTFLDFQLNIRIEDDIKKKIYDIKSNQIRRRAAFKLFIPLTENGIEIISWKDEIESNKFISKYNYGLLIEFPVTRVVKSNRKYEKVFLNSGIRLSGSSKSQFSFPYCNQYYNYPSSYLELDVARENILKFKNNGFNEVEVLEQLALQSKELVEHIILNNSKSPFVVIDNIYRFFLFEKLNQDKLSELHKSLLYLSISSNQDKSISIKLKNSGKDLPVWLGFDVNTIFYLLIQSLNYFVKELRKNAKNENLFNEDDILKKYKDLIDSYNLIIPQKIDKEFIGQIDEFAQKNLSLYFYDYDWSEALIINKIDVKSEDSIEAFIKQFYKGFDEFSNAYYRVLSPPHIKRYDNRYINRRIAATAETFVELSEQIDNELFAKYKEFAEYIENVLLFNFSECIDELHLELQEILSGKIIDTGSNKYKNLLLGLILTSFSNKNRKKYRISILDIYLRLLYYYLFLSSNVSIADAANFEIKI
jgi:3',5'-cyclic AMP phosphodiesterase CpdA